MDPFSRGEEEEHTSPTPPNPPTGDSAAPPPPPAPPAWQPGQYAGPQTGPTGYGSGYSPYGPYGPQQQPPQYGSYPGYGASTGYTPGYWQQPTPPQPPARRRRNTPLVVLAVIAGMLVLVVGLGGGLGSAVLLARGMGLPQVSGPIGGTGNPGGSGNPGTGNPGTNPGSGNPGTGSGNPGSGSTGTIDLQTLAGKLDPAIVDINGTQTNAQGQTDAEDAGTGVIITSDGEVLTNNHVIEGNSSMTATLSTGQTVPVQVLGEDPTADIALVQLGGGVKGLPTINIKNGASASISEAVAAFGNALGKGGVPASSQGSVTGLNQTITASLDGGPQDTETLHGLIEESAQICSGDSGGVLANAQGQYLGMLTAASNDGGGGGNGGDPGSPGGGDPGYPGSPGGGNGGTPGGGEPGGGQDSSECSTDGYVIPASESIPVVKQIESGQRTASVIIGVPGYLGVEVDPSAQVDGVQVDALIAGGGAAAAGLPETFVITAINGQPVTSESDLSTALQQYTPGTSVQVTWTDGQGGPSQTTNVTLGSGPPA